MPKLSDDKAARVQRAGDDWVPPPLLSPGVYVGSLLRVLERKTRYGGWWWDWTFEVTGDGRLLHFYASLRTDSGSWKLKQAFTAFGVSTEADTDELCGKSVRLVVSQHEDKYHGGELDNRVDRVLPLRG